MKTLTALLVAMASIASAQTVTAPPASQPTICGSVMLTSPYTTTTTISLPAQASSIAAQCTYYTGSIEITPDAQSPMNFTGQLTSIAGDLISNGSRNAVEVFSSSLSLIGGVMYLEGKQGSASVDFPSLISIGQLTLLNWWPNMAKNTLWKGTSTIYIPAALIRNTSLTEVHIVTEDAPGYIITDNDVLHAVDIRGTSLGPVTIRGNGAGKEGSLASLRSSSMSVELSRLTSAGDLTISDATAITLTNTATINGSLTIGNSTARSILLPQLKSVGGSMDITNNPALTSVEALALTSVGGDLELSNNSLAATASFPSLQGVERSVILNGSYTNITIPALARVGDNVTISSTQDLSCQNLRNTIFTTNSGKITGSFSCVSKNETQQAAGTGPSSQSSSGSDSAGGMSTGAKIGIGAGVGGGVVVLLIAALFFWFRRSVKKASKAHQLPITEPKKSSSTDNFRLNKAELDGDGHIQELHASSKAPTSELETKEMYAKVGMAELHSASVTPYDSMSGISSLSELPSPQSRFEMAGDYTFYEMSADSEKKEPLATVEEQQPAQVVKDDVNEELETPDRPVSPATDS